VWCGYWAKDQAFTAREQLKLMQAAKSNSEHLPVQPSIEPDSEMSPFIISVVTLLVAVGGFTFVAIKFRPRSRKEPLPPLELKILKAEWGNEHTTQSVISVIEQMPRNAITFHIDPYTLKCDPAPGVDEKRLDITYTFPGRQPETAHGMQGQWIVLPEDLWLKNENRRLNGKIAALEAECATLRSQVPKPRIKESLSDIEFQWRQKVRSEYDSLKWPQKIALKRVCEFPGTNVLELVNYLHSELGFGEPPYDSIVKPIIDSGLVFLDAKGGIEVLNGRVEFVHGLIIEKPLC